MSRHTTPSVSAGVRAITAIIALALVAGLAAAGLRLTNDEHRRHQEADARLSQQASVGAAMLETTRDSTREAMSARYGALLSHGAVPPKILTWVVHRADARWAQLFSTGGRLVGSTPGAPAAGSYDPVQPDAELVRAVGAHRGAAPPQGFRAQPTIAFAIPAGRRVLVIGFRRRSADQLLATIARLPRPWATDLFLLDAGGRVIAGRSASGAPLSRAPLPAGGLGAAAVAPVRSGGSAVSVATVSGSPWRVAVRASRRDVDAATSGGVVVVPWLLLGAAALAGLLVLWLMVRARRSAEVLAAERERALAVLAVLNDGYLFLRDGKVVDVNARLCALVGVEREALLGATAADPLVATLVEARAPADAAAPEVHTVLRRTDGRLVDVAVTTHQLPGAHHGHVSVVRDIARQKREERRLSRLASTDPLTGLANRGAFDHALADAVAEAERAEGTVSLVVFDVDRFKAVNDEHGHPVGDRVLAEVARRLEGAVRDGDLLARIGGEEFAWLLPHCGRDAAEELAERARRTVGARPFAGVGHLTLSAGVCEREARDPAGLYACADAALLAAKRAGRDRTVAITPVHA